MTELLTIDIGLDPNIVRVFGLLITWHGMFTALGIVGGVWLAARIATSERVNIDPDTAYTVGMVVVFSGLIGARALYVIERYGDGPSIDSIPDIFRLTEGGISIYGAIIGGAIGGWAYGLWKKLPAAAGADAAAFGMMLGLAIGRIGDIINGEHFAKTTDLPWAITYSHPNSPGFFRDPMHPAVGYELIGDLIILAIIALVYYKLRPKSGVVFTLAMLMYAVMRFGVSFLRLDSKEPALGLSTPQLIAIIVMALGVPLLIYFLRRQEPEHVMPEVQPGRRRQISRAERRRRARAGP